MAVLTFTGSGKLATWLTPDGLSSSSISDAITNQGWGVVSCIVQSSPSLWDVTAEGLLSEYLTYNYTFDISINGQAGENPDRVRNALTLILNQWFTNVSLVYTGNKTAVYTSPTDKISSFADSVNKAVSPIAGLTTTAMIGLAVAGVLIFGSILSSDRGRRYVKRYY